MKPIRLDHFIKALLGEGVNISGCVFEDGEKGASYYYLFKNITSEGGVSVLYGADHDLTGTMSRDLLVHSVQLIQSTPRRIAGQGACNLVIKYKSPPRSQRI